MDFIYALGGVSEAPGNLAVKFRNPSGTRQEQLAKLRLIVDVARDIWGD